MLRDFEVVEYFLDKDLYRNFAFQAHEKFKDELNWEQWAKHVTKIISETLKA